MCSKLSVTYHTFRLELKVLGFQTQRFFSYPFFHASRYIGISRICSSLLQCGISATSKIGVTPSISSLSYHLILIAKQYSWQICHILPKWQICHIYHILDINLNLDILLFFWILDFYLSPVANLPKIVVADLPHIQRKATDDHYLFSQPFLIYHYH